MRLSSHRLYAAYTVAALCMLAPLAADAYGQGGYYSQASYYAQGSYSGPCGSSRTVMAPPASHVAWGNDFLRDALAQLLGAQTAEAYSQGTYYAQGTYYSQGSYGSLGACITKYSYSAGLGGYAPSSSAYWGGGGGGGLVIDNTTVHGVDGHGSPGNGGIGYGGGGGGANDTSFGGSGAPGVVYIEWNDAAPVAPTISGPTTVGYGVSSTFTFTATDPEGDPLRYGIDWNGDGTIDQWSPSSATSPSGTGVSASYTWVTSYGAKTFKALAEDDAGVDSAWSTYTVTVTQATPVALLTASPASITTNQSSTLTWSSSNATSCSGTNFSTGGATSGSLVVSPTQTTTYTVTCTGPGGSDSSSKTVSYSCTPQNICSNGNVVNSCTGATIQMCSYGCSAGACTVPPPPSYPISTCTANGSSFSCTGHLQIKPSLIRSGGTTNVYWDVSNVSSCSVTGTNGDSWTGASAGCSGGTCSSGTSGKTTRGILAQTIYTLSCTGLDSSTINESQTVSVVPVFQEQ